MRFRIKQTLDREICHVATPQLLVTSSFNTVYVENRGRETRLQLPGDPWKAGLGQSRLLRRAFRLDKCNVVAVEDGLVIIRRGTVFHYSETRRKLQPVLHLRNCRNVLHQSIAVIDGNSLYFGEYGANRGRSGVPIYRSRDAGEHWETIFTLPPGRATHVHGCYADPFEDRVWVFTGDFENECHVLCADREFQDVEWIGDGTQTYRACNAFFEKDAVHWIMDSQLQDSFHIRLDRATRQIERRQLFPGPVWYIKRLIDGYYLAATAQEIGPGVKDAYAHLMASRDLETWEEVHLFEHDGLPKRLFKFGVIGFADGDQKSGHFYLFGEAIRGLDGKTALCEIR